MPPKVEPRRQTAAFGKAQPKPRKQSSDLHTVTSAYKIRSEHSRILKTNYFETLIHFLKANIGAGIFSLGLAIHYGGFIFGTVMTVVLGFICLYNMHTLVNSADYVTEIMRLEFTTNFPETVEHCFRCGPSCFRYFAGCIGTTVKVFIICTQLGFCSAYILFVSDTLQKLMMHYIADLPHESRIYILIVAGPLLLSALITNLKFLTPLSFISDILLFSGIVLVLYMCSADGYPPASSRKYVADFMLWPLFFGTTIFAFEGIAVVIPLHNEMHRPSVFNSTFGPMNVGMMIVIFGCATVGLLSFWKFGDDVKAPVTLNFKEGILADIVMICVALGILMTYAIQFHVAIDITWWNIVGRYHIKNHIFLKEIIYRLCVAVVTVIVAAVIPFLDLILSLIGSVFSSGLALFFPAMCDIALRTNPNMENRLKEPNKCLKAIRFTMDGITLVCGVVGTVTGTTSSVYEIYRAFVERPHG